MTTPCHPRPPLSMTGRADALREAGPFVPRCLCVPCCGVFVHRVPLRVLTSVMPERVGEGCLEKRGGVEGREKKGVLWSLYIWHWRQGTLLGCLWSCIFFCFFAFLPAPRLSH